MTVGLCRVLDIWRGREIARCFCVSYVLEIRRFFVLLQMPQLT